MRPLRSSLASLPPSVHGARDYPELARLGIDPDTVIDFSTNSNPYGPPDVVLQTVRAAVSEATLSRYPDRDCLALRAAIASAERVPGANILPGNGAAELIQLVALACILPGSRHLVLAPTFGEYRRAIQMLGGVVEEFWPLPDRQEALRLDIESVAAAIRRLQPDGIWLCNPNNPTGQQWKAAELAYMRAAAPETTLWIVDESYRYFAASPISWLDSLDSIKSWGETGNFIVLRSLTKEYALAGLRLGYVVAATPLIDTLRQVQPPWSVNSLAQVAGVAALQPDSLAWRQHSLARLRSDAAQLWSDLVECGLTVLPSDTTYALLAVPDGAATRSRLLERRLLVRDCTSFGLPGHIRVAAHRPADNRALTAALAEFKAGQANS
jgi:histidinol-phosphate aminotransferase